MGLNASPPLPFPWLKSHGPIEARNIGILSNTMSAFPWLKSHGPIEAKFVFESTDSDFSLSMAEKSWPH